MDLGSDVVEPRGDDCSKLDEQSQRQISYACRKLCADWLSPVGAL